MKEGVGIARMDALGSRELRAVGHAKYDDSTGVYNGATSIQRSCHMENRNTTYTFGPTLQKQNSIVAPATLGKISTVDAPWDLNLLQRKAIVMVGGLITWSSVCGSDVDQSTTAAAMESFEKGPPSFLDPLRLFSNVINTWKMGSRETYSLTTMQLNVADVQDASNREFTFWIQYPVYL